MVVTEKDAKGVIVPESADADALTDRLRQLKDGERVSYESLSEVIGRDVRGASCLSTARRRLWGEGIRFSARDPVGFLTRMTPDRKIDTMGAALRSTHRKAMDAAALGANVLASGHVDSLPNDKSAAFFATHSVAKLVAHATDGRRIKKVARITDTPDGPDPKAWFDQMARLQAQKRLAAKDDQPAGG